MKNQKLEFVIVGCGNVAWHLAKKISKNKEYKISVYNHQENNTLLEFAEKLNCQVFSNLNSISEKADFYFICVSDKAIASVAKRIKPTKPTALVMHTSGSLALNILGSKNKNIAVFYPLQSFSKHDKVNWSKVPIIIETSNPMAKDSVSKLADWFSHTIISLNYQERLQLHLAAVLVNNFTNALFVEAYRLLPNINVKNDNLLLPLIEQTVKKLKRNHPLNSQTGPAKRKDMEVMQKHIQLIGKNKRLKQIYTSMSELIMIQQKNKL